mgnify:CR=1 FL=1
MRSITETGSTGDLLGIKQSSNPRFSSGPTTKRPGWSLTGLNTDSLGRSHRAAGPKGRLKQVIDQTVYVSATPGPYELERTHGEVVEQVIRPTGLTDPVVEVRPTEGQIDDLLKEIKKHLKDFGINEVLATGKIKNLSGGQKSKLVMAAAMWSRPP